MTALVVAIALVVGILCSEVLVRSVRDNAWPPRLLADARRELQRFHVADNDDARQHHLIRGGLATLKVSVAMLVAMALMAAALAAPVYLLHWTDNQTAVYMGVSTVGAIAWWMMRRRRRRA
jgi:hypothetical protein